MIGVIEEGNNLEKSKIESEPEVHFLFGFILFLGVSYHMLSNQMLNFLLSNTGRCKIHCAKIPHFHKVCYIER